MIILNILLASVALATSICAIGGETWDKTLHGWKKITGRGWLAIAFACMTFLFASMKEFQFSENERQAKKESGELTATIYTLKATISDQKTQMQSMSDRIDDLRSYAGAEQKRRDEEAKNRAEEEREYSRAKDLVKWQFDRNRQSGGFGDLLGDLQSGNGGDLNDTRIKDAIRIVKKLGPEKINAMFKNPG
jgi:hypothetical protein